MIITFSAPAYGQGQVILGGGGGGCSCRPYIIVILLLLVIKITDSNAEILR